MSANGRFSRISYDAGFSRKVPPEFCVFAVSQNYDPGAFFHNAAIALPVSSQCINMHLKFIFGIEI